jgi:hypothetical protein
VDNPRDVAKLYQRPMLGARWRHHRPRRRAAERHYELAPRYSRIVIGFPHDDLWYHGLAALGALIDRVYEDALEKR